MWKVWNRAEIDGTLYVCWKGKDTEGCTIWAFTKDKHEPVTGYPSRPTALRVFFEIQIDERA